jgi:2-polyprenyl-6-methoxyphenol hydroxylase-like FAD-dependent oxidoreductase
VAHVPGLIVGAGPVGLAAGLFLARRHVPVRVIDARPHPVCSSRALAVNPRTLDLLQPTGVTSRMLSCGKRIHAAHIHRDDRVVATLPFAAVHPRYPHMLALSQAASERLLCDALEDAGGTVERGTTLTSCRDAGDHVDVEIESPAGGSRRTLSCSWLLAADGASSTVRRQLRLRFPGSALPHDWHLADVPLRTDLAEDHAHLFLLDDGGILFLLRVVDGTSQPSTSPVWRVVSTRPQPLSRLVQATATADPLWSSSFTVQHRVLRTLCVGRIAFAGDAAHLHSPIGARGMNLGIEDAWVFAGLVSQGRLQEYDAWRRDVDRRVVRRVDILSRLAAPESTLLARARRHLMPLGLRIPWVRRAAQRMITGLDHPCPQD